MISSLVLWPTFTLLTSSDIGSSSESYNLCLLHVIQRSRLHLASVGVLFGSANHATSVNRFSPVPHHPPVRASAPLLVYVLATLHWKVHRWCLQFPLFVCCFTYPLCHFICGQQTRELFCGATFPPLLSQQLQCLHWCFLTCIPFFVPVRVETSCS